jgi:prepilin peptidase CpaA
MMASIAGFATAAILFLFVLAVIYGAISDVASYTIPNRVSYGIALLFIPYAILAWDHIPVLLHAGLGLFVTALCIVFWKLRWFGGGDAKFVGALSFWMGPSHILVFTVLLVLTSIALIAILRLARRWNVVVQAGPWPGFVKHMLRKAEENAIPYGLPAAAAALITLVPNYLR